jgi:hypothetical protein
MFIFADGNCKRESGEGRGRLVVDTLMASQMATLKTSRRLRHKWRRKNVQNPKNDIKKRHKKISEAAGCFQLDYFYQIHDE